LEADDMIERTEEDEYREWKNRLASEYLETADMTPRTALRMQANSVTQNLFGNEYLDSIGICILALWS
jgi:hypothetical protein